MARQLYKYHRVNTEYFAKVLKAHLDLGYGYDDKINAFLIQGGYDLVQQHKTKSHPMMRLTILFYLICYLLLLISMPFKYLFTGKLHYSYNGRVVIFMKTWQAKLGLS